MPDFAAIFRASLNRATASRWYATGLAGLSSLFVYFLLVSAWTPFHRLDPLRDRSWSDWTGLAVVLFWFGYFKHTIAVYLTLNSNYCQQTRQCRAEMVDTWQQQALPAAVPSKVERTLGYLQNMWLESVSEAAVFVAVGLPVFLYVRPSWAAAFLVGALAHLVASFSGFHKRFCLSSCDTPWDASVQLATSTWQTITP
jgi:hypothetical protein